MADKKAATTTKTKVEVKTAVYKVHVHCGQCAKDIEREFTEFHGVEEVKVDRGAGKVTVKGAFDIEKLRVKAQKGCRRKVELIPPPKDVVTEVKTKEEEIKIITVKVPMHCPDCAVRVKEILLEHKSNPSSLTKTLLSIQVELFFPTTDRQVSCLLINTAGIYAAKTDHGKNTCVVEGVIDEKKLTEYIFQRTRKQGIVDKVEKKVIVKEIVEVKKKEEKKDDKKKDDKKDDKKKDDKKDDKKKDEKKDDKKPTTVVAPYFIPCTHPNFIDYSHPCHRCGGNYCSPFGGCGYPSYGFSYTHSELKGFKETAFLHCSHPNEFISEENPYACSVM